MSSIGTDSLLLETLMNRLQLRPPYLDTNSYLSQSLDDFLLPSDGDIDTASDENYVESNQRKLVAKEEAKLEKEIIKIIHFRDAHETLKPNSGQSVSVGDRNVCVGVHDVESDSGYRVWEWHGHIMVYDEVDGFSAEYIYGNYYERLTEKTKEVEVEAESKVKGEGSSGLRELIEELTGGGGGRVLHRNSINFAN